MKLGGIDVGTTGSKITVYDENGNFLHKEYREYNATRNSTEHQVDATEIWESVKSIVKATTSAIGNIDAIGVTSFGETFVCLDDNDQPLLPSMLYTDTRGKDEAAKLDADKIMSIAGVRPDSLYSLPKLMWIKNNLPEIYAKTKRVLLFEDFIVYMLSGVAQIDYSLAARTMGFDIHNLCWSEEIFSDTGIDMSLFAKLVPTATVAGKIKKELEEELGLSGTVIVSGCHDQIAAACGAGVSNIGEAVDGTGTVECITPVFQTAPVDKNFYLDGYCAIPFIKKNTYVTYAVTFTGGASVKWFKDHFAKEMSYKELDSHLDNTPSDVLLLPHFAGAGSPHRNPASKAAFVGITLGTTKYDLYKAIMEGVTYEMKLNLERIADYGIKPKELLATGGGASSRIWLQMKANILGLPITSLEAPEVGSVGTIMLTGLAIGTFKSLEEAASVMVKRKDTYYPDPEMHKKHMEMFEKFKMLYSALQPITEQ